jgi:starch phosphorylase
VERLIKTDQEGVPAMHVNKERFKSQYRNRFEMLYGKNLEEGNRQEQFFALALYIREMLMKNWILTNRAYLDPGVKEVYYLSIEFLPGPFLLNNLINLGIKDTVETALREMNLELAELRDQEEDPGLGSGGLGRLASAFMDSLASLGLPGHGYGLRYRYGLFEQKIINKVQVELPDNWLEEGCPWEVKKSRESQEVKFGGYVKVLERNGRLEFVHEDYEPVQAVPYDIPIAGYRNNVVNTMRLWSADAPDNKFDYEAYSHGDYLGAVANQTIDQALTQVLYPNDSHYEGKRLRLKQQYLLVSASLQSIIQKYKRKNKSLLGFENKMAIHVNDTHPSLAIPELMRILVDEEKLAWDEAWEITTRTISYTNHTVLPEALEKWPVGLFKELLPRIFLIVEEINRRLCARLLKDCPDKVGAMAIIAEGFIRMGNLAISGSHSVNGVAKIHTRIIKEKVMQHYCQYYPGKFSNKTNGITHRRWLLLANPRLADLISEAIGQSWIETPTDLDKLAPYARDPAFREKFREIRHLNKVKLAAFIREKYAVHVDPDSIYDAHVKRIHGYKRQLLNAFHIMHLYNTLKDNPQLKIHPRTFIFAGKAAPAYYLAKQIILLINSLAELINKDRSVNDTLKVVFLENYSVSLAELIIPAADVSEQLSTASKEASGTGNMKFMMNGAITIGTMDGANIEIRDVVGEENFFTFGHTAEEILSYYQHGGYRSWEIYNQDLRVNRVCKQLVNGFLPGQVFRGIYEYILYHNDEYFVLKDFSSYVDAQKRLETRFINSSKWQEMCVSNTAGSGIFSSDRTIKEYAAEIWKIKPVKFQQLKENEQYAQERVYRDAPGRRTGQPPQIID